MDTETAALVWFRDDLRVADNPALTSALETGGRVVAMYVLDEESPGIRPLGGAVKWWLHHSLSALGGDLSELGVPLVLRSGDAASHVIEVAVSTSASEVHWNRRYGGPERRVDRGIKAALAGSGIRAASHSGSLLFEPWTIQTRTGGPYSVFTPFWRACNQLPSPRDPVPRPSGRAQDPAASRQVLSLDLADLALLPGTPDWAGGLRRCWVPGEASAQLSLARFLQDHLDGYDTSRDVPSDAATSRLSPHLRFGEISPFQVWHATQTAASQGAPGKDVTRFLAEVGWREFAWHVLYHFPDLATRNWRSEFDSFEWPQLDPQSLEAWQHGRTGVALVDAGMRELWRTGWMHNRVRMVTASFLTKNLLIDWRLGEEWFWDTLVDADSASNPFGWQWVAGSGADAAPYFRVFNPDLQANKFDPDGKYIKANVPEWGTEDYPSPLVDLRTSRQQALAAYDAQRSRLG